MDETCFVDDMQHGLIIFVCVDAEVNGMLLAPVENCLRHALNLSVRRHTMDGSVRCFAQPCSVDIVISGVDADDKGECCDHLAVVLADITVASGDVFPYEVERRAVCSPLSWIAVGTHERPCVLKAIGYGAKVVRCRAAYYARKTSASHL